MDRLGEGGGGGGGGAGRGLEGGAGRCLEGGAGTCRCVEGLLVDVWRGELVDWGRGGGGGGGWKCCPILQYMVGAMLEVEYTFTELLRLIVLHYM